MESRAPMTFIDVTQLRQLQLFWGQTIKRGNLRLRLVGRSWSSKAETAFKCRRSQPGLESRRRRQKDEDRSSHRGRSNRSAGAKAIASSSGILRDSLVASLRLIASSSACVFVHRGCVSGGPILSDCQGLGLSLNQHCLTKILEEVSTGNKNSSSCKLRLQNQNRLDNSDHSLHPFHNQHPARPMRTRRMPSVACKRVKARKPAYPGNHMEGMLQQSCSIFPQQPERYQKAETFQNISAVQDLELLRALNRHFSQPPSPVDTRLPSHIQPLHPNSASSHLAVRTLLFGWWNRGGLQRFHKGKMMFCF